LLLLSDAFITLIFLFACFFIFAIIDTPPYAAAAFATPAIFAISPLYFAYAMPLPLLPCFDATHAAIEMLLRHACFAASR